MKLFAQERCPRYSDPAAGVTATLQGFGSHREAGTPLVVWWGGGSGCSDTRVLQVKSHKHGRLVKSRSPRKWTESAGPRPSLEPSSWVGVGRAQTPTSPPRDRQLRLQVPAAGTQALETSRRRRGAWRPRVPHPRPGPSPAAWVLPTHWPEAGRSGGSASTGSFRTSRGSQL